MDVLTSEVYTAVYCRAQRVKRAVYTIGFGLAKSTSAPVLMQYKPCGVKVIEDLLPA